MTHTLISGREGLRKKINEEFLSQMLSDQSTYSLSWRFSSEKYKEIKDKVLKDLEMRHDYTPGTSRGSSQSGGYTSEDEKKEFSSSTEGNKNATVPIDEQDSDDDQSWKPAVTKTSNKASIVIPSSIQTRAQSNKDEVDQAHLQSFNKK